MADFVPQLWPEDRVPASAVGCSKCELCRQRSRIIWGEGNPEAPILILLDNPGERENKENEAYVCTTRQTLQKAAFDSKLGMDDLYITYLLKCRPLRRYNKNEARNTCSHYLLEQLEIQKPKLAFCLGNTSAQWFFDDMEAEVNTLRGNWYNVRRIPTAVSYHPLAVRRRPNLLSRFTQDFKMLSDRYYREFR